ncbi:MULTISPECIES: YetF domain-containing protein [Sphingomonas]|uniref:YetF domain-containing protein n=1 Tax=Sphingomonas molluscorum TaxID=418184 RepID=A0ABU8Q409_9SPHN|nr:uncharacterized membrane protein YcaP (DUF421 family) [Sphingomonas sp. JUb134]
MDLAELLLGIGRETQALSAGQMACRAVVLYVATLAIVRIGKKRFLSRASAFDVIVGIVIGSIASRAITGNAPILPSLAAIAAVVALHWLVSAVAVRWHGFGHLIKGRDEILIREGIVDEHMLRAAHMTDRDLSEALREEGVADSASVKQAHLERNGKVSVIKSEGGAKVVDIAVAPGVQTVRIEIN